MTIVYPKITYSLCSSVLMLNPNVGSIVLISSPLNFFKIVVLPALSRPLSAVSRNKSKTEFLQCIFMINDIFHFQKALVNTTKGYNIKILISFSFCFIFFKIVRSPMMFGLYWTNISLNNTVILDNHPQSAILFACDITGVPTQHVIGFVNLPRTI